MNVKSKNKLGDVLVTISISQWQRKHFLLMGQDRIVILTYKQNTNITRENNISLNDFAQTDLS